MTDITDKIIEAIQNMGFGIHFITSRNPSEDPYASFLGEVIGIPIRGKVLDRRDTIIPEGLKGLVLFDKNGFSDVGFEYLSAHEYVHVRDLSDPSFDERALGPFSDHLTNPYEKLVDLRTCLMLPDHISYASYFRLIDGESTKRTPEGEMRRTRFSSDEEKQMLITRAQHYGGIENLPGVFEGLANELLPYAEQINELGRQQNQREIEFDHSIRAKLPHFSKKIRDGLIGQHEREYKALEAEIWGEIPSYLKLLTGYETLNLGRSPLPGVYRNLLSVKEVEGVLQTLSIPLISLQ